MKTRLAYGSEVTGRARRVVADIFAALGSRAEHAVLIGGAVPRLIEDKEGPPGIARKLALYAGDSVVASALAFLRVAFASPESAGSVAVARFEEAGEEDAERVSAQAYAVVQSFLGAFDVWGGEAARNGGES